MFQYILQCLGETALYSNGLEPSILCTKQITPRTLASATSELRDFSIKLKHRLPHPYFLSCKVPFVEGMYNLNTKHKVIDSNVNRGGAVRAAEVAYEI